MRRILPFTALAILLSAAPGVRAGLYYRGEQIAELPSQWRGFLLDQRLLRNIAIRPRPGGPANPARDRYQREAERLAALVQHRQAGKVPTAEDLADLGALYVRLGETARALDVLRAAHRQFPKDFHIVSNLGTAWQVQGDLEQAMLCLREAFSLAPAELRLAEEYQLKLVRLRFAQPKATGLDDLFGIRYVAHDGSYRPATLDEAQRTKLPWEPTAIVQRLALWLPADGKLLWQLAELANAEGDVQEAAAILDGCVTEFGMSDPELRRHRQILRAAADAQAAKAKARGSKNEHTQHVAALRTRSRRPLVTRVDQAPLPAIRTNGPNALPWWVLAETVLDPKGKPTFADRLRQLDGKEVSLTGFMQPLEDQDDVAAFLFIEYPVGCWYCEMPEITSIVSVELPEGKTTAYTRGQIKVTGRLQLNTTDPESFLYTISNAKVSLTD
jgi:tetratricopeptide (TPR) repeat protein